MSGRKNSSIAGWLNRTFNSPVSHLVISTLLFGILTFVLFWLTLKFNLLPQELLPSKLSQENTGLFDALGGWALGFAGALVAIRIADLAANIQQNDSIREQVNVWASHVEHISNLNSRLTRATYDAKRACAAVLLHAEDIYRTEELPSRIAPHLSNRVNRANKPSPIPRESFVSEERLQLKLEEKLEIVVEAIEEAFKDSVFRSVLEHANNSESAEHGSEPLIANYFVDSASRRKVIEIIEKDTCFFNISEGLNRGSRNFGVGLMELRAKELFQHFRKDLMRITEFQQQETDINGKRMEISDAAWLFLGLLLLRSKGNTIQRSQNHGFIFIALLLGSLPTDETVSKYLTVKATDVEKTYSKEGNAHLKMEIKELSKRLYFVKGEELKELAELIATCNDNLEYLEVFAKNTGISTTYDGDGAPGITKLVEDENAQDGSKGVLAEDTRKKG
ncbi:MAG: hypothetical protein CML20_12925 [Rheinheimera sp.]|nr:hypothetical protein [Rheinheimera sp.]